MMNPEQPSHPNGESSASFEQDRLSHENSSVGVNSPEPDELATPFELDSEMKTFAANLRRDSEQIIEHNAESVRNASKSEGELALAVYVDFVLRTDILGADTLSERHDDEYETVNRLVALSRLMESIASFWLQSRPDSIYARDVQANTIAADSASRIGLLYEIWPVVELSHASDSSNDSDQRYEA